MNEPARTRYGLPSQGLPNEIIELGNAVGELPEQQRKQIESAYTKVVDSVRRRRRILALAQEAMSQLRLDVKYLMFDLEATRREREELRRQLDDAHGTS